MRPPYAYGFFMKKGEKQMAQTGTNFSENLSREQMEAFRGQLRQMEQLARRQQEKIESCRNFLAERDLLAEYESRYGSLTAVDLGKVKEQGEELQEAMEEKTEQKEYQEKKLKAKKVLKI